MKLIYYLFLLFGTLSVFSQAPQSINYQGVVRNTAGVPITTLSTIALKFEISDGTSTIVHQEIQNPVAVNSLGIFNTRIGLSPALSNTITWQNGPYTLSVSVDMGSGFTFLGAQQMVSVPFALYAEKSGSSVSQSLAINGNSLSITGGNTIALPSNTFTATSITGSGAASVTSIGTNSFDVFVPAVNINGAGNTSVTGSFPNYTVSSLAPVNPNIIGVGATSVVSAGNNFTVASAPVNISGAGNTIVNGAYPNFTVSGTPPNIVGVGTTSVLSSGNNFTIGTSPVNISGAGSATVGGSYPNFTVAVASAGNPTITGTGASTVSSSGNSFTVNTPVVNINGTGATTVNGTFPNFTINSSNITPTITGSGATTVNSSGNSFTVSTPPVSISSGIGTSVTGTFPNYTVSAPAGSLSGDANGPLTSNTVTALRNVPVAFTTPTIGQVLAFNGAAWTPTTPPAVPPAGWTILGNSGTIDGTHYIGTNDNVPLNFRVNNQKSGRIDPLLSNSFFGYWAGRDNTTGIQNTAIGINALLANSVGAGNTAVGASALSANTGSANTAVGQAALSSNTTGSLNAAFGRQSLSSNATGTGNTALGYNAGYLNVSGSGNVFLGHQAGYNETGSNKLYIANSSANPPLIFGDFSTGRIGIGTTNPNNALDIISPGSTFAEIRSTGGWAGLVLDRATAADNGYLIFRTGSLDNWVTGMMGGSSDYKVFNWQANRTDLTITNTLGHFGIGTTSPSVKLHVNNTSGQVGLQVDGNDNSFSSIYVNATSSSASTGFGYLQSGILKGGHWINSAGNWNLEVNGAPRQSVLSNGRVGINVTAPTATFHVNGNVRIVDGTQGAGKVLTSDATGTAAWAPGPPKIAFNAGTNPTTNQSVPAAVLTVVQFGPGNNFFNDGGGYNTSTFQFTPPSPGVYHLSTYLSIQGSAGSNLQVWIEGPGGWFARSIGSIPSPGNTIVHLSATVNTSTTPGPYTVKVYSNSALTILPYDSGFSGFKVY